MQNRVIKFRAWDSELKFMVDPSRYELSMDGRFVHFENNGDWYNQTEKLRLMQFTGLKDKNGKEIYEGDILKNFFGNYAVCFDEDSAQFQFDNFDHYDMDGSFPDFRECEVIGNIYETPELLK